MHTGFSWQLLRDVEDGRRRLEVNIKNESSRNGAGVWIGLGKCRWRVL